MHFAGIIRKFEGRIQDELGLRATSLAVKVLKTDLNSNLSLPPAIQQPSVTSEVNLTLHFFAGTREVAYDSAYQLQAAQ